MVQQTVEIFKTNIFQEEDANQVILQLNKIFPNHKINFDLDDCDKILRVEGINIEPQPIINQLSIAGFQCELLV
jgi:hypothetical protein